MRILMLNYQIEEALKWEGNIGKEERDKDY